MADQIRMDTHKLIFHPERVANWLSGENIYPIELEVGLTNACNHRCIFCALDYTGYQPVMIDTEMLLKNLKEIAGKGLKSIVYAGEGEPLLHRDAPYIFNKTKEMGVDVAISTNGVLFTPEVSKECMKSLTWMRFSTSAIKNETYNRIQCGKEGDLQKVLSNMEEAVRIKKSQGLETTIGVQMLLLPDNKNEVVEMGQEMRRIGVDYFTIKPFSRNPQSQNILQVDYNQEMMDIEMQIKELETDDFKVYFRMHAIEMLKCKRSYKQCLALPFMVYIDAKGSLWPCIVFMGKESLSYGNLNQETFVQIWEGERRKRVVEYFMHMDLEKNCREICRLDEMNKYLNELRHPGEHVNFI